MKDTGDDTGVAIVRIIDILLLFSRAAFIYHSFKALAQLIGSTEREMEVAKKELQIALKSIRGRRVEKAELDALVQKTIDETKAKLDGASVPNSTWEYLLRSEILSIAVRVSFLIFDYQGG